MLAVVASDKLEKEYSAHSIQPSQWFPPRTIDFMITTVGTPFPTNLNHHNPISTTGPSTLSVSVLDLGYLSFVVFGGGARIQRHPSSLQFLLSATSFIACSRVSSVSAGGEYDFFFLCPSSQITISIVLHPTELVTSTDWANPP